MSKTQICLLFALLSLVFSGTVAAQKKESIQSAFAKIERQYQVKFNYTNATLANWQVESPDAKRSLTEQLEEIQRQIPLGFEIADRRYIIVTASDPYDSNTGNTAAYQLRSVSIQHYLTSGISKTKGGNYVIRPAKFGILPGLTEPDVLQTMQQIPGIYSAEESISNLNVRGGTHDQNLFLWNGVRMFQTGHFFGLISAFNPALPNKITISKNGSSAFYGESVSSVVDIETASDAIEKSDYGVGVNLISADFYARMKLSEKGSFMVSGRRSHTDAVNSPTYQKYYNRVFQNTIVMRIDNQQIIDYKTDEDFYFYDFTLQLQQKIGQKHELLVDGIGISNRLGIRQNAFIGGIFNSKYSFLEQQSYGGNISWKTIWNPNNITKANAYVSWYSLDATNESIEKNQLLRQHNSGLDSGLRIEHDYSINHNLALNLGYQYNEIGIANFDQINDPEFRRNVKNVLRSHAFVAESQYQSTDRKALFTAGIRTNYFEKFDKWRVEPRFQFNYALTRSLGLELLGEMKNQTASQIIDLQQDFMGIEKRRWTLADNNEVPIQKSGQLAVGLRFKNKQWLLTLDNFYKKVNGISTPAQAFRNQLETVKMAGNYEISGSEILVQRNFTRFYTWLSYGFNHNEYHFNNYDPSRFPNNFEIEHSVSGAVTYDWKQFKVAFGGKWNSGRPTTTPKTLANQQIGYNDPNNQTLDNFLQFNLSASYGWKLGGKTRLLLNLSVLNLFNEKNTINRYYRVNALNNTIESVNTYALERTPNGSVRLNF